MKHSDFKECLYVLDRIREILFEMYYFNSNDHDPYDAISGYIDVLKDFIGGN